MRYDLDGKNINIPDNFIDTSMHNLGITRQEAIDLYLSDNDFITNDEIVAMTVKAKAAGTGAKATGEKVAHKAPERKPDLVKRAGIAALSEFITGTEHVENVTITNIERMIAFEIGGDKFEVVLTKKRKPKE